MGMAALCRWRRGGGVIVFDELRAWGGSWWVCESAFLMGRIDKIIDDELG
jgi:hypothetical protein